ncbi:MAG: aldose 1-epimerase family protein [Burkholderiaceae bacterium]
MAASERVEIRSDALCASIDPLGAELRSLRTDAGHEIMWPGSAPWWERTSPILFPVIGRLRDGRVAHRGRWLVMPPHGFAMHQPFECTDRQADACAWQLVASDLTRAMYPFEFALRVGYRLHGRALTIQVAVENHGPGPMPFSLGLHPGFRWPIRAPTRDGHHLEFEAHEPAPTRRRTASQLLGPPVAALPMRERRLALNDALFAQGSHVLDTARSHWVRMSDHQGPLWQLDWTGLDQLALWTQPGAPFICVEPWAGRSEADGEDADLEHRAASVQLEGGQTFFARACFDVHASLCEDASRAG